MIYAMIWPHLTKSDIIAYLLYESMYIKLLKKKATVIEVTMEVTFERKQWEHEGASGC